LRYDRKCRTIPEGAVYEFVPDQRVGETRERPREERHVPDCDFIREGLRLLKERDNLESLRRDIRAGFAAIDRGEYEEYDENTTKALATAIKARGRQRLEEFRKKTGTK
jgi:Arc/MetJ-type ribon-helix-helix transcriptional regulator